MSEPTTLLETLERSGAEVTVYDVGRRVGRLSRDQILAFEQARLAYPLPLQRQAWIALVQHYDLSDSAAEPVIWFLRLDLDEQGLLVQAERDYLLHRLLESAQANCAGADAQIFLQDNPYAFRPAETRMALFHAQLSTDLGQAASRYYAHALAYFEGTPGWDQWEFVGYQGIADVACRHPEAPLSTAIHHLPAPPLLAICHCLENQMPSEALQLALLRRLDDALATEPDQTDVLAALIRALSRVSREHRVRRALQTLLAHDAGGKVEVLVAISGRAWEALIEPGMLTDYLSRLAKNENGQAVFNACISDLLSLPDMAQAVRAAMRDPEQPPAVRQAFGKMLSGTG